MAGYLLEAGTDRLLLEDGTGVYELDVAQHWSSTSAINKPVNAGPTLDTNSASIASRLDGSFDDPGGVGIPGVSIVAYGTPVYVATANTPRYSTSDSSGATSNFRVMNAPAWGSNPLAGLTIPIDDAWIESPGFPVEGSGDGAAVIIDTDGRVFGLYHFTNPAGATGKQCDWAGWQWGDTGTSTVADASGDSTGAGLSRLAGVVRRAEIAVGEIKHALVFATRFARPTTVVSPAKKTDGSYVHSPGNATSSNSIPEAQRIYLDPTINLDAISGITAFELMIGKALQTYGAYCIDNTGANTGLQIICESPPDASYYTANGDWDYTITDSVYTSVGVSNEYPTMSHIPWDNNLKVIEAANWDSGGSVNATLTVIGGSADAAGGDATLTSSGALTVVGAEATADGGAALLNGAAALTVTGGSAAADGGSVILTTSAALGVVGGEATADGGSAALTGDGTITITSGNADAAGDVATLTGAAVLTALSGEATAAGDVTSLAGAGALTVTSSNADAEGGVANLTISGDAALSATGGEATADGGSVTLTANALLSAVGGEAVAEGGVTTLTTSGDVTLTVTGGNADATGNAALLTGTATFITIGGEITAEGGAAALVGDATIGVLIGAATADGSAGVLTGDALLTVTTGAVTALGEVVTLSGGGPGTGWLRKSGPRAVGQCAPQPAHSSPGTLS